MLENVVIDPDTRAPDFDDASQTENTRCAYPIDFIPNAVADRAAPAIPQNIVMLTADAFGVLPPIAKLTPARGDVPLPLRLHRQGRRHREGREGPGGDVLDLLRRAVHAAPSARSTATCCATSSPATTCDCWLVNTGWTGGGVRRRPAHADPRHAAPARRRRSTARCRAPISAAIPYFGFAVPTSVPGVEPHILYPVKTWQDKAAFAETAKRLVDMFNENFKRFEAHVDADVKAAAPQMSIAA